MIDKVSEFFNQLKQRLSNPLIFSFIISWLLCNWPITLAVLNSDFIKGTGYTNIFNFINCHLNLFDGLVIPLLTSITYTFGFPYIRGVVNIFQAKISKNENDAVLDVLKGGKVSIEKYLQISQSYEKRTNDLESMIKKFDAGNDRVIQLENSLMELRKESSILKEQLADATTFQGQLNNSRFFEGDWKIIYDDQEEVRIRIEGQDIFELGKFGETLEPRSFIRNFTYDNRFKRLHFLRVYEKTTAVRFYDLEQDHSGFFGTENVLKKVRFERPNTDITKKPGLLNKDELGTAFNEIFALGLNNSYAFEYSTEESKHGFVFKLTGILVSSRFQFIVTYEEQEYFVELENDFDKWVNFLDNLVFSDSTREKYRLKN